ncbi:MAG: hypothetical protein AAGD43_33310, partial [Pseudomonadota bacterium]
MRGVRCGLHEWPVFPPHSSIEIDAVTAISTLRAHAARMCKERVGLRTDQSQRGNAVATGEFEAAIEPSSQAIDTARCCAVSIGWHIEGR